MAFDFAYANPDSAGPSSVDIGLAACNRGNFQLARQMLRQTIEQLKDQIEKAPRLIELTTIIADTYLSEGKYESAWNFYTKALHRLELSQPANSLAIASLVCRLAEISVLQDQMSEFAKQFDQMQHTYLMSIESDTSRLLTCLIDLSWALSVKGHVAEVQAVNRLIAQIKQLEEEEIELSEQMN